MCGDFRLKRLRGLVKNALVWGAGWSALALAVITALRLTGVMPGGSWREALGLAARFGIVGAAAGAAFSTVIGLAYHGRRLREISWVRFGIAGAVVTGVFVPLFLQAMNLLSGDGVVPWRLVLDDALWTAVFGGVVAGGTLKLAQRGEALAGGTLKDQLEGSESVDRLTAAPKRES
jgi:hypothetical protein